MRGVVFLIGLLCAFMARATPDDELLKNLRARLESLPEGKGSLIKSFSHHHQSYIYDQALAIIAFSRAKDRTSARALLQGLKSLQLVDGSLYFSYYLNGKSPYPEEGDRRLTGATAWVSLAATHFQKTFDDKEFISFNKKILSYLMTQAHEVESNGKLIKALKFSASDLPTTPWNETEIAALEHNIDAYAAFNAFGKLNSEARFIDEAHSLMPFISHLWDQSRKHFWSGLNLKTGVIGRDEFYLDNQSWTLLALPRSALAEFDSRAALKINCERLFVEHAGIKGFMDSKPSNRQATQKFVWSEGSLGQILAMRKIDGSLKCKDYSTGDLQENINLMKHKDGGVAYATSSENKDFNTASSVAGTAWMYFVSRNINPFQLEEIN